QPCIPAQDGPEATRRCPDHGDRLPSKDPRNIDRGARQPIYCVLEYARDRIVVFGRRKEQPVGGAELVAETLHGIPLYDGDVETADGLPARVTELKEAVAARWGPARPRRAEARY